MIMTDNKNTKSPELNGCMQFFGFAPGETNDSLLQRLEAVKQNGFSYIIASYKTNDMEQVKFDDTYYLALDRLVECCEKVGIAFWLEDYAPFPTGSANGAYAEPEFADKGKIMIDERHLDLCGPQTGVRVRIDLLQDACYGKAIHRFSKMDPTCRKRLGVVAYRVSPDPRGAAYVVLDESSVVALDSCICNGILTWDVPEGNWRVFTIFTTYETSGRASFMNLLSKESVALEIEKVHRPLYSHLKEKLGKSWLGFFYDEPEVGNDGGDAVFDFFMLPGNRTYRPTDIEVLPWSPEMPDEMEKRDPNWRSALPLLWYEGLDRYKLFRRDYMDAVSTLVKENYNGQVFRFCQEHGIHYIGHVLEDESCHTRLGCGPSHYFRQQYYQDEAGIDIIAGQILPGKDAATSWYGVMNADGEFYHYGLAKLASSEAHINPLKNNRTAAEIFAMYGRQGLAERKFLIDHLMINGVNRMLFADNPTYQAPAEYGILLASYANRMCEFLRNCETVIQAAILYHAEAEWSEGEKAQKFHRAAAVLARNQISYDVVPADVFTQPEYYNADLDGKFVVNGHSYDALVIPYPGRDNLSNLPERVQAFATSGSIPVIVTDGSLEDLNQLPAKLMAVIDTDIAVESMEKKWIRTLHLKKDQQDWYWIHNESPCGAARCEICLADRGVLAVWDPYGEISYVPQQWTLNGMRTVILELGRYEMAVLRPRREEDCVFDLSRPLAQWKQQPGQIPEDYYGKLTYSASIDCEEQPGWLDLGAVSDCCEVFVNGISVGKRAAAPWIFDIRDVSKKGSNHIDLEIFTSAGNIRNPMKIFGVSMDALTAVPHTQMEPIGFIGPAKLLFEGDNRA